MYEKGLTGQVWGNQILNSVLLVSNEFDIPAFEVLEDLGDELIDYLFYNIKDKR